MIKIGNQEFDILELPVSEMGGDVGYVEVSTKSILLSDSLSKAEREETLLHEIIHVVSPALTEEEVSKLSSTLYETITTNNLFDGPTT